jgi:hypothetical protein
VGLLWAAGALGMRRTALWELRAALMFTGWKIWTKLGGGVGGLQALRIVRLRQLVLV